ncbi:GTPase activating protein [Puccinia graminis f. sp. tritici]|uniref:GTPase activating protein n=1 Tax=Puccinia graminis f. sp. tritici TaxID=56615 RepID=A0A5B0N9V4_PUCGR|nr:GTPase activating protein [Puccinia graminis f. sp. tritici]KAA1135925.1 GTPase activating protein [Puccinia graminis f. sp. tritici]
MGGGPSTPPPPRLMGSFEETLEDEHLLEHSIDGRSILSDDLVEITRPMAFPSTEEPQKTDPHSQEPNADNSSRSPVIDPDSTKEEDPKPYKLRWSKSKVYIHPTSFLRDNLPGYLGVLQRAPRSFYLSWIPEQAIEDSSERDSWIKLDLDPHLSTDEDILVNVPIDPEATPDYAFSVPIDSIHSIILTPPTLSSWYGTVVINVFCGPTLPKLYFHDDESRSTQFSRETRETRMAQNRLSSLPASWGGEALLTQLRRFADVCQSAREHGLFLLNPSKDEREEHLTPIFSDDALIPPLSPPKRNSILHQSLRNGNPSGSMDEFAFNILSSFSKLTQNAKSAAQMVLSHRLAKPIIPHLPQPIASLANGEPEFIRWSQQAGVEGYDAARVYLAKWASIVAAQGERSRRAEFNDWDPEPVANDSPLSSLDGGFEMIHATYQVPKVRFQRASTQPIELEEFIAWQDDSGKLLLDKREGQRRIFQRGVAPAARKLVWLFLLGVHDWESTSQERESSQTRMIEEYQKLKASWETGNEELRSTASFQEEAHRIEIDCRRTDRGQSYFSTSANPPTLDSLAPEEDSNMPSTNHHVETVGKILMTYNVWEKELGYVQGMSDLCAPLYVVFEADEVTTYFAFVKLMEKMKSHFLRDQSGMRDELSRLQQLLLLIDPQLYCHFEKTNSLNLFFCFRWILISFKREFEFLEVLKVWEALWTDMCGPHSDLFLALAVLQTHREPIIRYLQEFDEVLKYINDIANTLECDTLLTQAHMLYLTYKSIVETRSTVTSDGTQVIQSGKRSVVVTDELKSLL